MERTVCFRVDGIAHRTDGPAVIDYFAPGIKRSEKWFLNGKLHREDGPSITNWTREGRVWRERYYFQGAISRSDGPAYREWSQNEQGALIKEKYYWLGRVHREDGPAIIDYKENTVAYFAYDRQLSPADWPKFMYLSSFEKLLFLMRRTGYLSGIAWSRYGSSSDEVTVFQRAWVNHGEYLKNAKSELDYLVRLARATDGYYKVIDLLRKTDVQLAESILASIVLSE